MSRYLKFCFIFQHGFEIASFLHRYVHEYKCPCNGMIMDIMQVKIAQVAIKVHVVFLSLLCNFLISFLF